MTGLIHAPVGPAAVTCAMPAEPVGGLELTAVVEEACR